MFFSYRKQEVWFEEGVVTIFPASVLSLESAVTAQNSCV